MKLSLFIITSILCSSCASVYFPNSRNAPMFSGKGEVQCSVATGTGNNVQAAYAITDHIGVTANGMRVDNEYHGKNNHNYGEIGLGYYKNFKESERGPSLYADFFAGYGAGNLDVFDDGGPKSYSTQYWFRGSYQKFFMQSGIALNQQGNFRIGFVYRLSFVDVSGVSAFSRPYSSMSAPTPYTLHKTQLLVHEPAVVFKATTGHFYVTSQGGLNLTFDGTDNTSSHYYYPIQFSLGLGLLLGLKKKKNEL